MSYWEERRADRAAEREQDRLDRVAREEADRRRREEEDERRRRERAEKRREKGQKRAARRARISKARRAIAANLDTTLAIVAMVCSVGPAFYFQIVAMIGAGAPLLIALALAVMLESGAQVATITGEKAKRAGRPVGPHRIAMWGCASIAAAINAAKAPALFPDTSWMVAVLALSSYGGVAFWELRGLGRHKGKGARTKQQRVEEKKRREHEKKRRKVKDVWARYEEILTAHPYGSIDPEQAWSQAWEDRRGVGVGLSVGVLEHRFKTKAEVDKVLADAERTPESLAVDALLSDLFPAHGKGEDGPGGTPVKAPTQGPKPGAPRAAKAQLDPQVPPTGRRGNPAGPPVRGRRRPGDTQPFSRAARTEAARTARKAQQNRGEK